MYNRDLHQSRTLVSVESNSMPGHLHPVPPVKRQYVLSSVRHSVHGKYESEDVDMILIA